MPAPVGNTYNLKWKTAEDRQEACDAVCAHLASGLSKASFPHADWDTVERYLGEFPEDFPTEKIREAERLGRLKWEKMGMDGAGGVIQGFNAASWIFNMKNRFPTEWRDKTEQDVTVQTHEDWLARLGIG